MSDELPEGWAECRLSDLASQAPHSLAIGPFGSSLKVSDYCEHGVPLVFVRDIRAEKFGGEKTKYVSSRKAEELGAHTVRPGDVLITKMGEPPGDTAIYPNDRPPGVITADCIKLTPEADLTSSPYLRLCIRGDVVRRQIAEQTMGVAQQKLSLARFREIRCPLPPLPEQRRIFEKVEALLEQVNRAKGRLDRVPQILKRFRQAVLAAACSGELTRDWRDARSAAKSAGFDELPQGWGRKRIADISTLVTDGDHNPPKRVSEGIPHLTARNVRNGVLRLDGCTFIRSEDFERVRKRYEPQTNDVIVTCVGTLGETAIVPPGLVFSPDRNLAAIRLGPAARPRFLQLALQTPAVQALISESSGSTAQPHLYLGDLRAIEVPLPPLDEQQEIVRQVERLFALADTIETRVQAATARADKLPQAILSKAFSGELVPTEAELARAEGRTYETAEELLRRVTAQPEEATPRPSGVRRRGDPSSKTEPKRKAKRA